MMSGKRLFLGGFTEPFTNDHITTISPPIPVSPICFPPGIHPVGTYAPVFAKIKLHTDIRYEQCIIQHICLHSKIQVPWLRRHIWDKGRGPAGSGSGTGSSMGGIDIGAIGFHTFLYHRYNREARNSGKCFYTYTNRALHHAVAVSAAAGHLSKDRHLPHPLPVHAINVAFLSGMADSCHRSQDGSDHSSLFRGTH